MDVLSRILLKTWKHHLGAERSRYERVERTGVEGMERPGSFLTRRKVRWTTRKRDRTKITHRGSGEYEGLDERSWKEKNV